MENSSPIQDGDMENISPMIQRVNNGQHYPPAPTYIHIYTYIYIYNDIVFLIDSMLHHLLESNLRCSTAGHTVEKENDMNRRSHVRNHTGLWAIHCRNHLIQYNLSNTSVACAMLGQVRPRCWDHILDIHANL